jgi:hypothetical protein
VYQIELLKTVDELNSIRSGWLEMINNSSAHSLEAHPDITIESFTKNVMHSKKIIVLVVKKDSHIVAIAPFHLTESIFKFSLGLLKFGRFSQRKLTLIGNDLLYSTSGERENCVSALMNHLHKNNLMDTFSIETIAEDSPLCSFLKSNAQWSVSHAATNNIVRQLIMPESHDVYLSSMKRKVRYNIKRSVKQMHDAFDGNLELKEYRHENEVEELLLNVNKIFQKCWQSQVMGYYERGSLSQIENKKFQAKNSWLRCFVLECNNSPIAFVMGNQFNGYFEYDETGFDPAYSKHSPGTVMTYLLIESLFNENKPNLVNFGYGENVYKKIFGNHSYAAFNILACHNSSKFHYILKIQKSLNQTYSIISNGLTKLGIDKYIRKILKKK